MTTKAVLDQLLTASQAALTQALEVAEERRQDKIRLARSHDAMAIQAANATQNLAAANRQVAQLQEAERTHGFEVATLRRRLAEAQGRGSGVSVQEPTTLPLPLPRSATFEVEVRIEGPVSVYAVMPGGDGGLVVSFSRPDLDDSDD